MPLICRVSARHLWRVECRIRKGIFSYQEIRKDYYQAQNLAKAEVNIRPQWLAGYKHADHFAALRPTANPYAGDTWRKFLGHSLATTTRDYLPGSSLVAQARDDQHAWFFHVEHAYLMSGNKWLKDWYHFMAEFKQGFLQKMDPWPDNSNRAIGHNLSVALAAYRVTANEGMGGLLANYIHDIHSPTLIAPHNVSSSFTGEGVKKAAIFSAWLFDKAFYRDFL